MSKIAKQVAPLPDDGAYPTKAREASVPPQGEIVVTYVIDASSDALRFGQDAHESSTKHARAGVLVVSGEKADLVLRVR